MENLTSEAMIRKKVGLLDLDMLVCRKNLRILQEKGEIVGNFITVEDNELSIDAMKEWQFYFRKFNVSFVLFKLRKMQEDHGLGAAAG